jgi:hypothetical protein
MWPVSDDLLIRPPVITRVFSGVVTLFAVSVVLLVSSSGSAGGAIVSVFCLSALLGGVGLQLKRVRVSGEELHVRNFLRDRVYLRRDIDYFLTLDHVDRRSATSQVHPGRTIVAKLRDGRSVRLLAASRAMFVQTDLEAWLHSLNSWVQKPGSSSG